MFSNNYTNYLSNEIKYGVNLFVSGWKKLILHPIETIKDTVFALYHPIQTGKVLLNEIKQHPVGMAVNVGLSWVSGRAMGSSVHYLPTPNISSHFDLTKLFQNSTLIPESAISSVSQVLQVGNKVIGRSCCHSVYSTTAARLGQTTSLITSQSLSANTQLAGSSQQVEVQSSDRSDRGFSPHFNALKKRKKDKAQKHQDSFYVRGKDVSSDQRGCAMKFQ